MKLSAELEFPVDQLTSLDLHRLRVCRLGKVLVAVVRWIGVIGDGILRVVLVPLSALFVVSIIF